MKSLKTQGFRVDDLKVLDQTTKKHAVSGQGKARINLFFYCHFLFLPQSKPLGISPFGVYVGKSAYL